MENARPLVQATSTIRLCIGLPDIRPTRLGRPAQVSDVPFCSRAEKDYSFLRFSVAAAAALPSRV